jgi:hypothetical protein
MRYPYRRLSDVLKNATYHDEQNFGLKVFMEDLKFAYKKFGTDVAFVPISQTKSYVYIPGDQTPLGIVGYEQIITKYETPYASENIAAFVHTVESHTIKNLQYSSGGHGFNRLTTIKRDKAVKIALANLQSFNAETVVKSTAYEVTRAIRKIDTGLEAVYEKQMRELFGTYSIKPDALTNIFASARVSRDLLPAEYIVALESIQEAKTSMADKLLCRDRYTYVALVNTLAEHKYVDLVHLDALERKYSNTPKITNSERIAYNEVPEDIVNKVAALAMLENDTFIDGLGYRLDEGAYYVFMG